VKKELQMRNTFIVVGDQYAEFANHQGVTTYTAFMEQLQDAAAWSGDELVVIGLGIADHALRTLLDALAARGIRDIVWSGAVATPALTHKRKQERGLITEPRRSAARQYDMWLYCDDALDRLSDHVTGQHVSAMLLLEAARQAIIASVELEYVATAGTKLGMVIDHFNTRFLGFVFPIPTKIHIEMEEVQQTDNQLSLTGTIVFIQAGQEVCEMDMSGALYDPRLLHLVETKHARRAVRSTIASALGKPAAAPARRCSSSSVPPPPPPA
jgi:hypothetical protein